MTEIHFVKKMTNSIHICLVRFPTKNPKQQIYYHEDFTLNGEKLEYEYVWDYVEDTFYFSLLSIPFEKSYKVRSFKIEKNKMKKQFDNIIKFLSIISQNEYASYCEMKNKKEVGVFYECEKAKALVFLSLVNKNKIMYEKGMKKLQEENLKLMDYFEEKNLDGDLYEKIGNVCITRSFVKGDMLEYEGKEDKGETYLQFADCAKEVYDYLKECNDLANKIGWWD